MMHWKIIDLTHPFVNLTTVLPFTTWLPALID